jgi:hypothetical protein
MHKKDYIGEIKMAHKIILRNSIIIVCSALGSCILFSPAKDFSTIAIAFLTSELPTAGYAINFGIFSGIASVSATTILGFNSWNKILSLPDKSFKTFLKRTLCYLGGIITSAPLIIDGFQLNQSNLNIVENLISVILPGIFISGVYGYSIEFLYNEFTNRNIHIDEHINNFKKRVALSFAVLLGSISAIGCYWESLNVLLPLTKLALASSTSGYILSTLPVICRAPLFIESAYNVIKKIITNIDERSAPSFYRLLFIISVLVFSICTVGGYCDITHNGMTQSSLYQTSPVFHHIFYPFILGVAMFCMLLLNAYALIVAADNAKKYFSRKVNKSSLTLSNVEAQ